MAFGFFKRAKRQPAEKPQEVEPQTPEPAAVVPPEPAGEPIVVSRTLVKSQPELVELVASVDELTRAGVSVGLAEKGFGTRVEIRAAPEAELGEDQLTRILDGLAEAQRRPFTND